MKVGASKTAFSEVKKAFESVYAEMGITCEDIGGVMDADGNYYSDTKPCVSSSSSSTKQKVSVVGAVLGSIVSIIAVGAVGFIFWLRGREKTSGKPYFTPNSM